MPTEGPDERTLAEWASQLAETLGALLTGGAFVAFFSRPFFRLASVESKANQVPELAKALDELGHEIIRLQEHMTTVEREIRVLHSKLPSPGTSL